MFVGGVSNCQVFTGSNGGYRTANLTGINTVSHAEFFQTQGLRVDIFQIDIDGFAVVGADLDGQLLVAAQDFNAVEIGLFGDTVDFRQTLGDFILDGLQVACGVRTVLRLYGQTADVLQVIVDFVQRAFGGLRQGDTVVSVTGSLSQAFDVSGETVGDRLTRGIVLGAVDAQTGRQTLNRRAQGRLGFVQVVLRHQRQAVGINYLCHYMHSLRVSCVQCNVVKRFGLACPRRQPPSLLVSTYPLQPLAIF